MNSALIATMIMFFAISVVAYLLYRWMTRKRRTEGMVATRSFTSSDMPSHVYGVGPQNLTNYATRRTPLPPQEPKTAHVDNSTSNLMMGAAIVAMMANSESIRAETPTAHSNPEPDLSCRPSDGDYGGGGASSSWDGGSSSDSGGSVGGGSVD